MRRVLLAVMLSGCAGEADWVLQDGVSPPSELPESRPLRLSRFTAVSDGLPAGAEVRSTAHLDGTLYAVVEANGRRSLFALEGGQSVWKSAGPTLRPGEEPQALTRLDVAVYLTAADFAGGKGSVHKLEFSDEGWSRLSAPDAPARVLTKKTGALLLAVGGDAPSAGLYASADRGKTWTQRSSAAFLAHATALAASPAAARMFATGDVALGFGKLYHSDDAGATWAESTLAGEVGALSASAEFVLVQVRGEGTWRSDNYGNTFHPVALEGVAQSFFTTGPKAFAGTSLGVRVSDDGGRSWRDASDGLPSGVEVKNLYLAGSSLFAASRGAVFVAAVE
ncbi:MAG: WD40/YVTN/BNR-like repeat-containing protein [Myxococcota bacterium]